MTNEEINEKIEKARKEFVQAQEQLNEWNAILIKKSGVIEFLQSMIVPEESEEKKEMIKTEIAASLKALISTFCLYVLSMDAEFVMSVVAFIVIIISNFSRFKLEIKTWYKSIKNRFK